MPVLTLLVARALNGSIGHQNKLPWHLPEDLAHFKRTTMGKTIIMGRLTWDSIGRVLPGRQMVVVTRGNPSLPAGVRRAASLAAAIADNAHEEELFVIGGAQIFAAAMPIAHRIIMTEVNLSSPGDTWMDKPDPTDWREVSRQAATSVNGIGYSIITYARRGPRGAPNDLPSTGKSPVL
jgi:dihydrofolate reductase